ncbi:MAG: hypothetical protein JSS11_05190 [Verrucomicrobia bacterium]|nr:hypothetical protein [Verrucomicrobiota bacterium]
MTIFLRHLELCLTLAGLGVIMLSVHFFGPVADSPWRSVAIVATLITVVHGFIAWAVRRHQQQRRKARLLAAQNLLNRLVLQEQAITASLPARTVAETASARAACAEISRLVTALSDTLHRTGAESLASERANYSGEDNTPAV